jgi:hypothetical protein
MLPIIGQKGVEFNPVIELVEPDQYYTTIREMRMAADIGNTLANVYPGYAWLVNVNFRGLNVVKSILRSSQICRIPW